MKTLLLVLLTSAAFTAHAGATNAPRCNQDVENPALPPRLGRPLPKKPNAQTCVLPGRACQSAYDMCCSSGEICDTAMKCPDAN